MHRISTEADRLVIESVARKEGGAMGLFDKIPWQLNHGAGRNDAGRILPTSHAETGEGWDLFHGDSVETIDGIEDDSVGLAVFSRRSPACTSIPIRRTTWGTSRALLKWSSNSAT